MDLKILKFLVTVLISSRLTHQITTPEDRCQISESGFVCIDCFTRGSCFLNEEDETYSVIFESSCENTPSRLYCDDTIAHPQNFGSCSLLPADATDCSCSSSTQCIADVNNPAVVLHCEDDTPETDPPCYFPLIDLDTCSCASDSEVGDCFFLDDPTDDCTKYFVNINRTLTAVNCSAGTCFNQTQCNCVKTEITCPADCPFVDDQDGNCRTYFVCAANGVTQVNCSENLCFDQESCGCIPATETSPIPSTCPPGCPFLDDPNDNCASYFICSGSSLTQVNCTTNLCFDQELCGCVEKTASDTSTTPVTPTKAISTTPSTPLTCSSGCPYVDDPNDLCSKFYICDGPNLIPHQCPGTLCFSQVTCQCQ